MMSNPMTALVSLQEALDAEEVVLKPCALHSEIKVLHDEPNGGSRFTYAIVVDKTVQAIAMLVHAQPYECLPCFQLGYAVLERSRRRGVGRRIAQSAIAEFKHGMGRNHLHDFYVEAVVSADNGPSNAIARRLFSDPPASITDKYSNESALQYVRKVTGDS